MRVNKLIFLFAFLLFCCHFMHAQESDLEKFLPIDHIAGWWPDSEITAYEGDDLFFLINGGADLYLEYGFVQVVSRSFRNAERNSMKVEIYEMTDEGAAFGIYSLFRTQENSVEAGSLATVMEKFVRFCSGKYFGMIMLDQSNTEAVKAMLGFTRFILRVLPKSEGMPAILAMLPDEEFISDQVKYFRGHLGLSNIYHFNTSDIFGFQEGVTGNYGTYSLFILKFKDEEELKEIVKKLPDKLVNNKKFSKLEIYDEGFHMRDNQDNTIVMEPFNQYLLIFMGEQTILQPELFERIRVGENFEFSEDELFIDLTF